MRGIFFYGPKFKRRGRKITKELRIAGLRADVLILNPSNTREVNHRITTFDLVHRIKVIILGCSNF